MLLNIICSFQGMKIKFTLFEKVCKGIVVAVLFSTTAFAQVSMGKYNTYYSQNFDGLPNKTNGTWVSGTEYFTGWRLHRTKPALTDLVVNTGASNTGNLYSYGASGSTDRALGALGSLNAGEFAYGLLLQNNTASNIVALDISYIGEQWRSANSTTGIHRITFWYAISSDKDAFNLWPSGDKGWTHVSELTFLSPVYHTAGMALDGNAAANRRMLSHTLRVTIPNGHYIMLRWKDADEPEADHGLAIDDFSLTWRTDASSGPTIMPVELKDFKAEPYADRVELNWETASEENNDHFVIERSSSGHLFEEIGLVKGVGTSSIGSSYTFRDEHPISGVSYYRLKQVDTDGTYSYSKIVSVSKVFTRHDVHVYPTATAHTLNLMLPPTHEYKYASVVDLMGKQVLQLPLEPSKEQYLNVSSLSSGMYVLVLKSASGSKTTKRFRKV